MKRVLFLVFIACQVSFFILGCGYTTRSMISDKYRTIYVTPFTNQIDITSELNTGNKFRIYRPHLETDVTNAVINRYLFDGNLRPVKKEKADLILKGEIVDYRKDPLRYTDGNDVSEYRMNLIVNISLWDNKDKKMLWEANGFTGYFEYFTNNYPLTNVARYSENNDVVPLNKALEDLARRIVERTVNEW